MTPGTEEIRAKARQALWERVVLAIVGSGARIDADELRREGAIVLAVIMTGPPKEEP